MKIRLRHAALFLALALPIQARSQSHPFDIPSWAFPGTSPYAPGRPRDLTVVAHIPGSSRAFTLAQVNDALNPPDWFPDSHPAAPDVVIHGRKDVKYGCGLCHLPNGQGRSENATIVGLKPEYFLRQIADLRSGARKPAAADWPSSSRMIDVVKKITDDEARAAAEYFGSMKAQERYRVVESVKMPATYEAGGLLARKAGADSVPLAGRLMEVSNGIERHELRDPNETFTTYVPVGSIARGRRIALNANLAAATRCATCHGADLRGTDVAPPLAGRSPAYILRQLIGFRTGARATSTSLPMQIVTAGLRIEDMTAVAAYAGSRKP